MCAPTTRRLPRRPRATFPVPPERSGYEREGAIPGCLGTGVPDYAEGAQGLPRGEGRPEAARTRPQRERARVDLRLRGSGWRAGTRWRAQVPAEKHAPHARQVGWRGDRMRARAPTARRQGAEGKRRRAEQDNQVLYRPETDGGRTEARLLLVPPDGHGPSPGPTPGVSPEGGRQGAVDLRTLGGRAVDVTG